MLRDDFVKDWEREESASFAGWDFSHIENRWESELLSWEYKKVITSYLKQEMKLLDMGTGGGEFLLSLNHPYENTWVTEDYPPNYELCIKKLRPLGITVERSEGGQLSFEDGGFDLVLNRHESYSAREVRRVLKKGGLFVTQQVGGRNNVELSLRINPNFQSEFADNNLENSINLLEKNGFEILESKEEFPSIRFFDTGAFVYFAKVIEWEFPGFSVASHLKELMDMEKEVRAKGFIEGTEHRYYLVSRKIK